MEQPKRTRRMIVPALSDEQLALLIAEDYKKSPNEFSTRSSSEISNSKDFLFNTSARGINPMKKWL